MSADRRAVKAESSESKSRSRSAVARSRWLGGEDLAPEDLCVRPRTRSAHGSLLAVKVESRYMSADGPVVDVKVESRSRSRSPSMMDPAELAAALHAHLGDAWDSGAASSSGGDVPRTAMPLVLPITMPLLAEPATAAANLGPGSTAPALGPAAASVATDPAPGPAASAPPPPQSPIDAADVVTVWADEGSVLLWPELFHNALNRCQHDGQVPSYFVDHQALLLLTIIYYDLLLLITTYYYSSLLTTTYYYLLLLIITDYYRAGCGFASPL